MPDTATIAELVSRMPKPAPDGPRGGILSEIDKPALDKTIDALVQSGAAGVTALIDMLVDKDPPKDSEARHALHAIVFRVGSPGHDAERSAVAQAMAAAIGGDKPKEVQAFLIRQLQYVGRGEVASAIGKVLLDEDLCDPACAALVAIRDGAAAQLRDALPKAAGRQRMAIIQALGQLRDTASAELVRKHMADENRDTRICAGWTLAVIGDAASADALIKACEAEGWERMQAVKNCLVLAENLAAAGKKSAAQYIYKYLRDSRTDASERYVRDIAVKALEALG